MMICLQRTDVQTTSKNLKPTFETVNNINYGTSHFVYYFGNVKSPNQLSKKFRVENEKLNQNVESLLNVIICEI